MESLELESHEKDGEVGIDEGEEVDLCDETRCVLCAQLMVLVLCELDL